MVATVNTITNIEDILLSVLIDACGVNETVRTVRLDSACIQSYSDAMLYLADCGLLTVESISGRRVICRLPHQAPTGK